MRLVTLLSPTGPVAAVERGTRHFAVRAADGATFEDVGALLCSGPRWRRLAEAADDALPEGLPSLRPVLEPGVVACVGMNYRRHIEEMGREPPTSPTWFSKPARALADPGADVRLPAASHAVDYEGELAVVIGSGGRDIPRDRAWDAVAGLTLLDDVSMRDFQMRTPQWFAGKAWEASTALGPAVVTIDELPDLGDREIVTRVNGEERQRAPLSDLLFDVPALVEDLSRVFTLRPGDVLATGTPSGVGHATKTYLRAGDVVEVALDGIGVLRTRFVA